MHQEISDRIAAAIRDRGGPITAQEIAREHLKLVQGGPPAEKLVRAMLCRDARFAEVGAGSWGLASTSPGLAPPVVLWTCEAPAGTQAAPWLWRVSTRVWGADEPVRAHQGPRRTADLEGILAQMAAGPVATAKPGLLRRWLGTQERLHACPELDPVIIDLAAWEKLLPAAASAAVAAPATGPAAGPATGPGAVRAAVLAADQTARTGRARSVHPPARRSGKPRPEVEPDEGPTVYGVTAALGTLLEQVVSLARERGLCSWREVALVAQAALHATSEIAWGAGWAFTPEEIASLPEEPGVYRFLDREGRLLYVGKAKNLRSRIGSYFRPMAMGSSRRAAFLAEVHRLETESTGTELEALLREAELIRLAQPIWNVQVNLAADEVAFSISDQDLVLLLPRPDGALSLLALGGARVARTRIDAACDLDALREALRSYYVEGTTGGGLDEVGAPERVLVRRWLRWSAEGHVTLGLSDFATFTGLTDAIGRFLSRGADPARPAGPGIAGTAPGARLLVREGPEPR